VHQRGCPCSTNFLSSFLPFLTPALAQLSRPDEQAEMVAMLWRGLEDAVEHRHGKQRLPLIAGIGQSVCVSDITKEELEEAVAELYDVHGL